MYISITDTNLCEFHARFDSSISISSGSIFKYFLHLCGLLLAALDSRSHRFLQAKRMNMKKSEICTAIAATLQ